jgi:hypothetical protein
MQRSCRAHSAGMRSFTAATYFDPRGVRVSEQERMEGQEQGEERLEDMDVAEEQQDDVTGGRMIGDREGGRKK